MSEQLARLMNPPTPAQLRDKLLAQLQGLGWTYHGGFSPGSVTVTGVPTSTKNIRVKIITTGDLGTGVFQYSLDGGTTFSANQGIPANGIFGGAFLAATGCNLIFANGVAGTPAGTSFQVGDVYQLVLTANGFPVTSWVTLSVPLSMVENDAEALADLYALLALIARGGFIQLAAAANMRSWVDQCAEQVYGRKRVRGVTAQGLVTFTDAGGTGPHVQAAGGVVSATAGGLRYINDAGFTIPHNGTVQVALTAEAAGSQYNVGNNAVNVLVTSIPGTTVNNPDPGTGTWITRNGTDDQTDQQLAADCMAQWPALGVAAPTSTYDRFAKEASNAVTKTAAFVDQVVPGQTDLYLAGNAGPVAGGVVTAVQNYVTPRVPITGTVVAASAAGVALVVQGDVEAYAAQIAQAQAETSAYLTQLIANAPIGGIIYLSQVIDAIQRSTGVRRVVMPLTSPIADTALTPTQVASLTNNLNFIAV